MTRLLPRSLARQLAVECQGGASHGLGPFVVSDFHVEPSDQAPHLRLHRRLLPNLVTDLLRRLVQDLPQHLRVTPARHGRPDTFQHVFEKLSDLSASCLLGLRLQTRPPFVGQRCRHYSQTYHYQCGHDPEANRK